MPFGEKEKIRNPGVKRDVTMPRTDAFSTSTANLSHQLNLLFLFSCPHFEFKFVSVIDNDRKLTELLARLRQTPWIALDTEADSLHAYPEKVCLLQISSPSGDELIDPLAEIDLTPLLQTFSEHELIIH